MTVPACYPWKNNGRLIEDIARLGYIQATDNVLDPTYGKGVFWKYFRPPLLTACDLDPRKSPIGYSVDFTNMPFDAETFDVVSLDGPYKLNGRPDPILDERYGTDTYRRWQDRYELIYRGIDECWRVLKTGGILLVKCQDQVCSGQVRWQTYDFRARAEQRGMKMIDRFDMTGTSRPQPGKRKQKHAHGRPSTMLVFAA